MSGLGRTFLLSLAFGDWYEDDAVAGFVDGEAGAGPFGCRGGRGLDGPGVEMLGGQLALGDHGRFIERQACGLELPAERITNQSERRGLIARGGWGRGGESEPFADVVVRVVAREHASGTAGKHTRDQRCGRDGPDLPSTPSVPTHVNRVADAYTSRLPRGKERFTRVSTVELICRPCRSQPPRAKAKVLIFTGPMLLKS
jgi:hypothetical protein